MWDGGIRGRFDSGAHGTWGWDMGGTWGRCGTCGTWGRFFCPIRWDMGTVLLSHLHKICLEYGTGEPSPCPIYTRYVSNMGQENRPRVPTHVPPLSHLGQETGEIVVGHGTVHLVWWDRGTVLLAPQILSPHPLPQKLGEPSPRPTVPPRV